MDITTKTAEELRKEAADCRREAAESFARCDTDGFLSQWASGLTARLYELQAEIVERGGVEDFALFDLSGNLVAAKNINGKYGPVWALLESDDPNSRFVGFFNESGAQKEATRVKNNARKGFYVGQVLAPGKAKVKGSGTGLSGAANAYVGVVRTDGGFSRDVKILDNGK